MGRAVNRLPSRRAKILLGALPFIAVIAAFVPLWVFRLVLKGLIVSPLLGHWSWVWR